MTRGFLLFCIFLVVGAVVYQWIIEGNGYLLIVLGKTSIEMNLWFAGLCLLIGLLALWFLIAFLRGGLRGVVTAKQKLFSLGDEKAQARALDGLIDYIEGNWSSARKKLTRSAKKVRAPLINYLAAARSAYEMGDEQGALELLHKAETCTSKGGLAVAITQARMQLGNQQYEQALATMERAAAINPEHPVVLSLRQQAYTALKDWSALKALLPQLAKHNIGSTTQRHYLELNLHKEQLKEQIEKQKKLPGAEKLPALEKLWSQIPSHLQREQFFLSTYASQLMSLGQHDKAEKLLAQGLNRQWHGQWVDLYGLLHCRDVAKPLKTAEKWLPDHSQSANLLLGLGRLCLQNQQWGRAVDFLQQSLALQKRTETYAELARVYDYLGEHDKSLECYQQGLLSGASVLSDGQVFHKPLHKVAT